LKKKKHLITKYNKTKSDIEDIKNTLKQVENQEVWFQTIDYFGNLIREDMGISEPMRRELLNTVIDFILVDYDLVEKVHRLKMNFKLPVVTTNTYLHLPYIRSEKTSETLDTLTDQTLTVENYSTVTQCFPTVTNITQHPTLSQLKFSVEFTSSNLWVSSYTPYQQELFDMITKFHDEDGLDFKRISDWLNSNGYLTPRGKVFRQNHVWSIYKKKMRSIKRFSREFDHVVTEMKLDVVESQP